MVLKRQRNLSLKSVDMISEALKLSKSERDFFQSLVEYEQSARLDKKDEHFQKMLQMKQDKGLRLVEADQYECFSHWYVIAVLEAFSTPLAHAGREIIAESLKIDVKQVDEAIELLLRLGFLEQYGSTFKRRDVALRTDANVQSLIIRKYHREMIEQALRAIDSMPTPERELQALTISLSKEKFEEVKKRFYQFQSDLNAIYSDDPSPEKIYQINIQMFPLVEIPSDLVGTTKENHTHGSPIKG